MYTADQALARLVEGNKRFVGGKARFPTVKKEVFAELAKAQQPYATIVGCSDSRVPPELVFDAGFGELFIVRVAGNVISPEVTGTLQYAAVHLHTPLFVILGHEGCGAVQAALAAKFEGARERAASRGCSSAFFQDSTACGADGAPTHSSRRRSKRTCAGRCGSYATRRRARREWPRAS
jgi:carbonic anhydrase